MRNHPIICVKFHTKKALELYWICKQIGRKQPPTTNLQWRPEGEGKIGRPKQTNKNNQQRILTVKTNVAYPILTDVVDTSSF